MKWTKRNVFHRVRAGPLLTLRASTTFFFFVRALLPCRNLFAFDKLEKKHTHVRVDGSQPVDGPGGVRRARGLHRMSVVDAVSVRAAHDSRGNVYGKGSGRPSRAGASELFVRCGVPHHEQ